MGFCKEDLPNLDNYILSQPREIGFYVVWDEKRDSFLLKVSSAKGCKYISISGKTARRANGEINEDLLIAIFQRLKSYI